MGNVKKTKFLLSGLALVIVLAILTFSVEFLFYETSKIENNLINISELSDTQMAQYLDEYSEMSTMDNKENILIVISKQPLENTFGATKVVEAPNHQYFLQYDSEIKKISALSKLQDSADIEVFENNVYKFLEEEAVENTYNSWGIEAMGLDHASSMIDGLEDVPEATVAILDTGLDMDLMNKYFPDKVSETYNVSDPDGEMVDEYGHGTHIAGTIAEGTPSNVKILPIKLSSDGFLSETDIITAINYVTYYEKADVMNMSFGGRANIFTQPTYLAIEAAKEKNIISVAAAGNEATSEYSYPAAYDNTISVSAIDSNYNIADFSNYGDKVTFAAPGVGIKSIMDENTIISLEDKNKGIDDNDSDFETIDGTSMATPHVVNAVAILKSLDKNISFNDTIKILSEHVEDLGADGWDRQYGYGMISLNKATVCSEYSVDCDDLGIFEIDVPDEFEISEVILTPYNYGSLTNILATTVSISTTNGGTITKALGDFDVDEIEINGYDPYASGEQTVTVAYDKFEVSFSVANPENYEMGWEYNLDWWSEKTNGPAGGISGYKDHGLGIKTIYFPEMIDGVAIELLVDSCIFGNYGGETYICQDGHDASNYETVILPGSIYELQGLRELQNLKKVISYADELRVNSVAFSDLKKLSTVRANILFPDYGYYTDENNVSHHLFANGVFFGDESLKEVSLSNNNVVIPNNTFYGCKSLTSISLPDSIVEIQDWAFGYSGVNNITGGENLAKIGTMAFYRSSLQEFHAPASFAEIGDMAFAYTSLKILDVSPENSIFDSRDNSNSIIKTDENKLIVGTSTTIIPSSVETIAQGAFYAVNELKEFTIPEGVITLESQAFFGCINLRKIILPKSLQSITQDSLLASGSSGSPFGTIYYVHQDSYALSAAQDYGFPYVIIEETDPDPIAGIYIEYTKNIIEDRNTFEAFQTINQENLNIYLSYYDEDQGSISDPVKIENYSVTYQDNRDSLRASTLEEPFFIEITFDDVGGYHNLKCGVYLIVEKATPTYDLPVGLAADPGQQLSEIELPEGFSWMDEEELVSGAGEVTYYLRFTPEDTDNYIVVEDIPVTVYVATNKTKLIPEFKVGDLIIEDTTPLQDSDISIENMADGSYTISNIESELATSSEYFDITFTLRMSDEMFELYYFEGGLQEKEFSIRTNAIHSSNEYIGAYDGEYHTISFNLDISDCTVVYSNDGEDYDVTELPMFKDIGVYDIFYNISCANRDPIIGSSTVMITGVSIDTTMLRENNIRFLSSSLDDLWPNLQIAGAGSIQLLDSESQELPLDTKLATGYTLNITSETEEYIYDIVVVGDTTGDGDINSADLLSIRQHLIGSLTLTGPYYLASDLSDDNQVNSADLLRIKQHLLGINIIGAI